MQYTIICIILLILQPNIYSQINSNITISSSAGRFNNSTTTKLHVITGEPIVHKGPNSNTLIKAGFHYTIPQSEDELTFYTERDTVQTGDTITVAIKVTNLPAAGLVSFDQTIQFDTSKLGFIDYTNQSSQSFGNINTANVTQLQLGYFQSGSVLTDSATVGIIRFYIKMNHGENATFSLANTPLSSAYDAAFNYIAYTEAFDTIFTINPAIISGQITTEIGVPMPYIAVVPSLSTSETDTTDMLGAYTIKTTMGNSISIHPERHSDMVYNNGVNVADIITIIKHIGPPFTPLSDYKKIAANVSASITNDCAINSFDLYQIQQLILGAQTSFGGKQYEFVPSTYNFPSGFCVFPDSLYYANAQDTNNQDFIGIKLGDVTDDWNNTLRNNFSNSMVSIAIDSCTVLPNGNYTHHITAQGMHNIVSYQMTITWDSTIARLDNIIPNGSWAIQSNHYNAGTVTVVFFDLLGQAVNIPDGSTLFSLEFSAIGNAGTATPIDINSSITPLMVFDNSLNSLNVQTQAGLFQISSLTNLPIELRSFTAQKGDAAQTTEVNWVTSSEQNTDRFVIEWSADGGLSYEAIGQVTAKGNSTTLNQYQYTHLFPVIGSNYYRLKTIDKDGTFYYSKTAVITFEGNKWAAVHSFPNPFNDQITIQFNLEEEQDIQLELLNTLGQVIVQKSTTGRTGQNSIQWDLKQANLPSGAYWLSITNQNQRSTHKVIKE